MKKRVIVAAYFLAMIFSYIYVKPIVEKIVSEAYYTHVNKKMVSAKPEMNDFKLGFYKPELPMVYADLQKVEKELNRKCDIVSIYQAWGDGKEHKFNYKYLKKIAKKGYTPMITWEPWLAAFDEYENRKPDKNLQEITNGNLDWFIRDYAQSVVKFGKPMYIRYAHEMSNPWYSWSQYYKNTPEEYVASWKHVVDIFREEGATNVSFVWTPYTKDDDAYFPGEAYVDVIGLDVFNFGTAVSGMNWNSFYNIAQPMHEAYAKYNKPFMIAEVGTSTFGGDKADWHVEMFKTINSGVLPNINGVVMFDNPVWHDDNGLAIDWSISEDKDLINRIKDKIIRRKQ